jgi:hypothetical protein
MPAKKNPAYHKGLAKSTQAKRQAQFNKQASKHWDDPSAYKKAPGDSKKTRPSKWNKKFKKMYEENDKIDEMLGNPPGGNFTGESDCMECGMSESNFEESDFTWAAAKAAAAGKKEFKFGGKTHPVKMSKEKANKILDEMNELSEALSIALDLLEEHNEIYEELDEGLSEKTRKALKNKAKKANAPMGALTTVYNKGLAAWRTGHRPGAGQHAWAMARVNSFLAGGPARKVDAAQWKKVQKHRKKK